MPPTSPASALSIAGSDCSAGAGIQADLKTFQHFHVHGLTAITCVVSETANTVRAIHPIPPDVVVDQVSLLLSSFPVRAIKTGMLYSRAHIEAIVRSLAPWPHIPLVVDPVMIASTGDPLIEPDAIAACAACLIPRAALATPNLPEAETLLGSPITDLASLPDAALALAEKLGVSVLLKGGHIDSRECTDILAHRGTCHHFSTPRLPVRASHGTGCTLSSAITAQLALGASLPEAVAIAKSYLTDALRSCYSFSHDLGELHALNQGTVG